MRTPTGNDRSRGTRIRWTAEERQLFIDKGARLLREKPRWKPLEIVRGAMSALPANRQRDVFSRQAFEKDYLAMVQRANQRRDAERPLEKGAQTSQHYLDQREERGAVASLNTPTKGDLYAQVASLFAEDVAKHLEISRRGVVQEIQTSEKDAYQEIFRDVTECVKRTELLMEAVVRELGVTISGEAGSKSELDQSARGDSAQEMFCDVRKRVRRTELLVEATVRDLGVTIPGEAASKSETVHSAPECASEAQAGNVPPVMPDRTKKVGILVIGARGRQIESIKREFSGEPVRFNFAQGGSSKSLHNSAEHVVVMKDFVGHRDTLANPHATIVDGGVKGVKAAIRRVLARIFHETA